jgi:glycine oxidase
MGAMKSVVVVGAGVVGLFCAVRLAQAGARVTLLEAETEDVTVYGPGASAAAAGMLAPLQADVSPHTGLAFASLDLWRRWQSGAEWSDGVRFEGGVIAAGDSTRADALLNAARTAGRSADAIGAGQLRKRTGLRTKLEHAIFTPDEGVADPIRVLTGLAMQARALGAIVSYGDEVESFGANAVTTYDGATYDADVVVVAAGFWGAEKLRPMVPVLKHVSPARGHIVPVALDQPLGPNFRAERFYLAQRREDIVLGATMEPGVFERRVDASRVEGLLADAESLLPGEVKAAGRAWTGVRPMSPDGWPMVGPSGDVLVAAGHSRNGWLLAPVTAEIITAYVTGAAIAPEWAALSPARFETQ